MFIFSRLPGVMVGKSGRKIDPFYDRKSFIIKAELLSILAYKAHFYEFKKYPWPDWILSFFLILLSTLVLYFIYSMESFNFLLFIVDLLIYYISFYILYNSEIENVFVDKKVKNLYYF